MAGQLEFDSSDDKFQEQDILNDHFSTKTKCVIQQSLNLLTRYVQCRNSTLLEVEQLPVEDLDKFLSRYYDEMRKRDGSYYKLNTLLANRYGLQQHFKNIRGFDIVADKEFKSFSKTFSSILAKLKVVGKGTVNHKLPITSDDLKKLYLSEALNTDHPRGLQNKVFVDIMVNRCHWGQENLRQMKRVDFYITTDSSGNRYVGIRDFGETSDLDSRQGNMYEIRGSSKCPVMSFEKYLALLNKECPSFWQKPNPRYPTSPNWYCNTPIGHNTLSNKMKTLSIDAKLSSNAYTNHCLRACITTVPDHSGFVPCQIMSISDQKSKAAIQSPSQNNLLDNADVNNSSPSPKFVDMADNLEVPTPVAMIQHESIIPTVVMSLSHSTLGSYDPSFDADVLPKTGTEDEEMSDCGQDWGGLHESQLSSCIPFDYDNSHKLIKIEPLEIEETQIEKDGHQIDIDETTDTSEVNTIDGQITTDEVLKRSMDAIEKHNKELEIVIGALQTKIKCLEENAVFPRSNASNKLSEYREEGYLCDTVLVCKGKEYKIHGVLLAAASPYFESVLRKITDDRWRHVTLPDVELSTIETLLHIVYTGKLPSPLSSVKNLLTVISQLKGFGVYFKEFDDCVNEIEISLNENKMMTKSSNLDDDDINVGFVSREVRDITSLSEIGDRISTSTLECVSLCSPKVNVGDVADTCSDAETQHEQETGDQIINSTPKLVCETSDKQFTKQKSLLQHTKFKHVATVMYSCRICCRRFYLRQNLKFHLKSHGLVTKDSTKKEICKTCGLRFLKRKGLIAHIRYKHKETVPYSCQICCKSFYLRKNLRLHLKAHGLLSGDSTNNELSSNHNLISEQDHPRKACSFCGIESLYPWNLSRHVKTVHLHSRDYVCQYCSMTYASNAELKKHLLKHENLPAKCKVCGEVLATNSQVDNHRNLHLESGTVLEDWLELPRIHKCRFCEERFEDHALMRSHTKIHAHEYNYQCTFCPQKFGIITQYRTHTRMHRILNQPKSHLCQVCGESFHYKSSLQNHLPRHSDAKPFHCHHCGKFFRLRQGLKNHMWTHTREKPYKCEFCGKGFSQDCYKKTHLYIHTGEKPYVCNQPHCKKSFRLRQGLNSHMRTHTGEKPYKCEFCGRVFRQNCQRKTHLCIHTGEKPYVCNQPHCKKSFRLHQGLIKHMRTHTGEKPYKCEFCGKGFRQDCHKKTHLYIHTGEKPYVCHQLHCKESFRFRQGLIKHMRTHTGEIQERM